MNSPAGLGGKVPVGLFRAPTLVGSLISRGLLPECRLEAVVDGWSFCELVAMKECFERC